MIAGNTAHTIDMAPFPFRIQGPGLWENSAHKNLLKNRDWANGVLNTVRSSGRKGVYEYYYLTGISKNSGYFRNIEKTFRSERFFTLHGLFLRHIQRGRISDPLQNRFHLFIRQNSP
jgi:hypothetical protein